MATWSPQGRIHQIEYAMEAVKQVRGRVVVPCVECYTWCNSFVTPGLIHSLTDEMKFHFISLVNVRLWKIQRGGMPKKT